jgi:hypothetical protein
MWLNWSLDWRYIGKIEWKGGDISAYAILHMFAMQYLGLAPLDVKLIYQHL